IFSVGHYSMTNGTLAVGGDAHVGGGGFGELTLLGGTTTIGGSLYVGHESSGTGVFSVLGSAVNFSTTNSPYIGYNGVGSYVQSDGIVSINNDPFNSDGLVFGYTNTAAGVNTGLLSGGALLANSEFIGFYGSASLTQSGGTHLASNLFLGHQVGS